MLSATPRMMLASLSPADVATRSSFTAENLPNVS
jgi:hypothetical protein